jgi:type IV pilus biogenesis protein CpaD/CtpE
LPPPDLSYMTDAIASQPPPGMVHEVQALVARLKRGSDLTLHLTAVAPPVAGREYAIGLAARVADTLRAYLRGQGVPQRRITRSVIDPQRETVSADERVLVELRLMKN